MTQRKDRREIEAQIAEADRIASEGIGRYRQGDRLKVTIHEGDDVAKAMEKALAEHVARHPEDAGRTVADFRWIVHEIVTSAAGWRPPVRRTNHGHAGFGSRGQLGHGRCRACF